MNNSTDVNEPQAFRNSDMFIFVIFLECVGLFLAVTLNCCQLIVLTSSTSLFTGNLRLCLRLLAVFDVLGGVICYGITIFFYFNPSTIRSSTWICNVAACATTMSVAFSQSILFIITIDRYIAVTRPLKYYNILSQRKVRFLLLLAFILSASISLGRSIHSARIGHCDFKGSQLFGQRVMAIYQITPLSFVIAATFLNLQVLRIAYAQRKRDKIARKSAMALLSRDSTDARHTLENTFSERCKSAITISAVVGASYLVWTPYLLITIIIIAINWPFSPLGMMLMYWFLYATFWLNPLVFGLCSINYRNAIVRLIRKNDSAIY